MLLDDAPVGGDEADRSLVVAQHVHHRCNGMTHGVVPRTAREAQPAVHGQLPVCSQPQLCCGQLDRGREARVHVHMGDVVDFQAKVADDSWAVRHQYRLTEKGADIRRRVEARIHEAPEILHQLSERDLLTLAKILRKIAPTVPLRP